MKKTRFPSGVTLIELVIVLAISAILIVIAASTNRNRGKREFDNGMKQLVTDIKTIQNDALAGLGPDKSKNCQSQTEAPDDISNNPTICPAGLTFGKGIAFGTPTNSALFGTLEGVGSANLGKNYLLDDLAVTLWGNPFQNFGRVRPYRSNPDGSLKLEPYSKAIPSNIGYAGSCYTELANGELPCDFANARNRPVQIVFSKSGQSVTGDAVVGSSSIPLTMHAYESLGFIFGNPQTQVLGGYTTSYQKEVALFFTDTTGKYTAAIHIIPKKNQINLCFDGSDC